MAAPASDYLCDALNQVMHLTTLGNFTISGDRYTVRRVGIEALHDLYLVYRECEDFLSLGPDPDASYDMVCADLRHSSAQGGIFCGIYVDSSGTERLIGVIDFIPMQANGVREHAVLSLLMIAFPYRGKGLGAGVVQWFESHIRQDPVVTCILAGVQVNNPQAIRFWQRMGYTLGSTPIRHADGTLAYDLKKEISAG